MVISLQDVHALCKAYFYNFRYQMYRQLPFEPTFDKQFHRAFCFLRCNSRAYQEALAYKSGTIRAVAYDEAGNVVAEDTKSSFEDPAKIMLSYEREDDIVFVDISTVDKNGVPVENARNRITVSLDGGGLLGLDNGDSTDYEQYKCNSRKLFNNHLLAIVRLPSDACSEASISEGSSGTVRITAVSKDLEPAVLTIGCPGNTHANCTIKPDNEVPVRKIELTVIDAPRKTDGRRKSCKITC